MSGKAGGAAGPGTDRRRFLAGCLFPLLAGGAEEPGFTSLFDGRTLGGWTVRDGPESAFYARDGAIVIQEGSGAPAWLRSDRQYENFDLRGEFFLQGWSDSGIYIHAPEHGRNTWCGVQIKLFHQVDKIPTPQSMGSVFPLVAPLRVNVKDRAWNPLRIYADWPVLRVWVNDEMVQDLDVTRTPDLRYRLRRGYLGIASLSYPLRFRNLRIRELPSTEKWETLYGSPEDLAGKWFVSEGEPGFQALGSVLRGDGVGHIATRDKYKDLELQCYVRAARYHNGGLLFRSEGKGLKGRTYEIQLHNVEEAHFPTGSLYYHKRSVYPRIEDEKWYLLQLWVEGRRVLVRINGENVMEHDGLENLEEGHVELQTHRRGYWTEFKDVRIKRL